MMRLNTEVVQAIQAKLDEPVFILGAEWVEDVPFLLGHTRCRELDVAAPAFQHLKGPPRDPTERETQPRKVAGIYRLQRQPRPGRGAG